MKKTLSTLLSLGLCLACSHPVWAQDIERAVAEATAKEYLQEQLKARLANFLNQNPHLLRSASPEIGTKAVKFLSEALAVHGFLHARNDRERAWSASSLLLSPEPTTAAVLFAVQLTDTVLALRSQKTLALIYERIAEIQAQTLKIWTEIYSHEFESQKNFLQDYNTLLDRLEVIQDKLLYHPVTAFLLSNSDSAKAPGLGPSPGVENIEEAIGLLTEMSALLHQLERTSLLIEAVIEPEKMGMPKAWIEASRQLNRSYDTLRSRLSSWEQAFTYFFASLDAARLKRQIENDLSPSVSQLRVYKHCVSVINTAATESFWTQIKPDFEQSEFMRDCQERFQFRRTEP